MWDIATEGKVASFYEHNDYVRAGAASPVSPELILSGSYDHTLKLHDCRTNGTVLTVNHGSPVESTLFLPSGGIFISAGGTEIKVWDIFNGGKLLANISQHHKTVTTLRLASNNSRLLSASLDRHVKIYDISTFNVVHNIDFPNAVLSMAVSENDEVMAVGMVDGIISIRKRDAPIKPMTDRKKIHKFAPDHVQAFVETVDNKAKKGNDKKYAEYDVLLRKMEFSRSLAAALKPYVSMKHPESTIALLHELLRRKVLHIAMRGLNDKNIGALLTFFLKFLGEIRFTRTLIDAVNVFIDVYENEVKMFSERNLLLYNRLQEHIKDEVEVCKRVNELEGYLNLLLSGAQINTTRDIMDINDALAPSFKARKDLVIDV